MSAATGPGAAGGPIGVRVAATDADHAAADALVVARPEGDMLQLRAWGDAMAPMGQRPVRLVAEAGGAVRGAALALVRPTAAGRTILYVPHGPVWDRDAPDADRIVGALLTALRDLARSERGIVVKVDPRARPLTEDETDRAPVAATLAGLGLRRARFDLQARTTRILTIDAEEADRVGRWKKEARNRWRRAAREGTTAEIVRDADPAALEAFWSLLAATAATRHFSVRPRTFYEDLARGLGAGGHLRLGIASWDGRPIAARFVAVLGDRAVSLYRATDRSVPRETYGHHALMGGLLEALAAEGVRTMDMWGVAEPDDATADPAWRAFSEFKLQFGGRPVAHPGTFDLVTDPLWYLIREVRERLRPPSAAMAEEAAG